MKIKLMFFFCDKDDCIFFLTKEKGLVRLDVNKLAFRSDYFYFFFKYDLHVSMKYYSVKKKLLVCTLPINFKYYILYL